MNDIEIIPYKPHLDKYIPTKLIDECFVKGQVVHVDKTMTGNGATHSFLNILEVEKGCINLLIEANAGVVESKHNKYKSMKESERLNETVFFYSGSDAKITENTKLIVTTVDSFMAIIDKNANNIWEMYDLVNGGHEFNRILVDEMHSIYQQSTFRPILRGFLPYLIETNPRSAIVTITATPLVLQYYNKTRYKINKVFTPETKKDTIIHQNNNYTDVISEIKEMVKDEDKNVIVFTNSMIVISNLTEKGNANRLLKANIVSGAKLKTKIYSKFDVEVGGNLTVISNKGFEGVDIDTDNNYVYFFQDFNLPHQHFLVGNIVQAFNRTRNGYVRGVYCSLPTTERYSDIDETIDKVMWRMHYDASRDNVKKPFTSGDLKSKGKIDNANMTKNTWINTLKVPTNDLPHSFHISKDERYMLMNCVEQHYVSLIDSYESYIDIDRVNVYRETKMVVEQGINSIKFKNYLQNRGFKIVVENEHAQSIDSIKTKKAEMYIKSNSNLIADDKIDEMPFVFDTLNIDLRRDNKPKEFIRQFNKWLMFKNHNEEYNPNVYEKAIIKLFENTSTKKKSVIEYGNFNKYLKRIEKDYKTMVNSTNKYTKEEKRSKINKFNQKKMTGKFTLDMLKLLSHLVNEEVVFEKNEIKGRDYNLVTQNSIESLQVLAEIVKRFFVEIDIVSCNPRIIYAICGLELPDNFYGENKKNKNAIHKAINTLSFESNGGKSSLKDFKRNTTNKLINLGFDERVVEYLITNFVEYPSNKMSQVTSNIEQKIINALFNEIGRVNNVRRHDSVISFNRDTNIDTVNNFTYNINGVEIGGWFNIEKIIKQMCYECDLIIRRHTNKTMKLGIDIMCKPKAYSIDKVSEIDFSYLKGVEPYNWKK